jgi:preprotein translocase subunit SecG
MGGQSAFGTKAGDFFTRVTIVAATVWILLCIAAILVLNPQKRKAEPESGASARPYTKTAPAGTTSDEPKPE